MMSSIPNNVTTRIDSICPNQDRPGGFVDVTLWLNIDKEPQAVVRARLFFKQDEMSLPIIRRAALSRAHEVLEEIARLYSPGELPDVPDDFWGSLPLEERGFNDSDI